jgi:hypothetical protein
MVTVKPLLLSVARDRVETLTICVDDRPSPSRGKRLADDVMVVDIEGMAKAG